MKLLITWIHSGIWKHLTDFFTNTNNFIYWISRYHDSMIWWKHFLWDINDISFLQNTYQEIEELDYLILNAWVWYFDSFQNIKLIEHSEIINTNLLSPILASSIFLPKIKKWIIFIGSISSKKSGKFWASYAASKFWLRGFAMNLKNELTHLKIHIIHPKIIPTNFHKNSKIVIVWKYQESKLEDISQTIQNIFLGNEKRFEIDL